MTTTGRPAAAVDGGAEPRRTASAVPGQPPPGIPTRGYSMFHTHGWGSAAAHACASGAIVSAA